MKEFAVGDKVRIRQWDDMVEEFGLIGGYKIPFTKTCETTFTDGMKHLCGRTATITHINYKTEEVELDFDDKSGDTSWFFFLGAIEPIDDNSYISKLRNEIKLLRQNNTENNNTETESNTNINVLADYESALRNEAWIVDLSENDLVYECGSFGAWSEYSDHYMMYPTEEYAKKAYKMDKFNGMLMAFKWCYDKDYEPDWGSDICKYRITYNTVLGRYDYALSFEVCCNLIYFSSEEVAQKCADWLNDIDPKGELMI